MPPQPLNRIRPNLGFALGIGFLGQRPEAAGLVAQCIAAWTEIELQLGRVMAGLLGIEHAETALAMYLAIENQRIRLGVLRAAAERVLGHRDKKLFDAILGVALAERPQHDGSLALGHLRFHPRWRDRHGTRIPTDPHDGDTSANGPRRENNRGCLQPITGQDICMAPKRLE